MRKEIQVQPVQTQLFLVLLATLEVLALLVQQVLLVQIQQYLAQQVRLEVLALLVLLVQVRLEQQVRLEVRVQSVILEQLVRLARKEILERLAHKVKQE